MCVFYNDCSRGHDGTSGRRLGTRSPCTPLPQLPLSPFISRRVNKICHHLVPRLLWVGSFLCQVKIIEWFQGCVSAAGVRDGWFVLLADPLGAVCSCRRGRRRGSDFSSGSVVRNAATSEALLSWLLEIFHLQNNNILNGIERLQHKTFLSAAQNASGAGRCLTLSSSYTRWKASVFDLEIKEEMQCPHRKAWDAIDDLLMRCWQWLSLAQSYFITPSCLFPNKQ